MGKTDRQRDLLELGQESQSESVGIIEDRCISGLTSGVGYKYFSFFTLVSYVSLILFIYFYFYSFLFFYFLNEVKNSEVFISYFLFHVNIIEALRETLLKLFDCFLPHTSPLLIPLTV